MSLSLIISFDNIGKQFSTKLESTLVGYAVGHGDEQVWRNSFSLGPGDKERRLLV